MVAFQHRPSGFVTAQAAVPAYSAATLLAPPRLPWRMTPNGWAAKKAAGRAGRGGSAVSFGEDGLGGEDAGGLAWPRRIDDDFGHDRALRCHGRRLLGDDLGDAAGVNEV